MTDNTNQSSEENLLRVLDKNADSIVVIDSDGAILYFNSAAKNLFSRAANFEVGELFGFPVADGEVTEVEVLHPSGERIVAEMRVVEIAWHNEAAYLASLRDVTQRKLNAETLEALVNERTLALQVANEKLQKLYQEEHKAAKIRAQFIANFSNEVRTPLSGILSSAELLLLANQEDREGLTQLIYDSAKQFMVLIDTILDFSKLESGHHVIEENAFNLRELLALVIETYKIPASTNNTKLLWTYDDRIPDQINADSGKVRQILLNLVTNAIKFTKDGEVKVDAKLESSGEKQLVRITVSDTGIGIDPSVGLDVFRPFVQANSGIFKGFGGTGLGLAISKELVSLLGGEINFESTPRKGSSFWFTFPIDAAKE